jgi:hypothetical protein
MKDVLNLLNQTQHSLLLLQDIIRDDSKVDDHGAYGLSILIDDALRRLDTATSLMTGNHRT